jgi:hypothetical protein
MPEMESIRCYYVVFWIRFRSPRLTAAQREHLSARFGLIAGGHGAVALAVECTPDRLHALLGVHPRREPEAVIEGIGEELKRWAGGLPEGADFDWEDDYAAVPLTSGEAATLLDVASGPGIPPAGTAPEDGWWEEVIRAEPGSGGQIPAETARNLWIGEVITS